MRMRVRGSRCGYKWSVKSLRSGPGVPSSPPILLSMNDWMTGLCATSCICGREMALHALWRLPRGRCVFGLSMSAQSKQPRHCLFSARPGIIDHSGHSLTCIRTSRRHPGRRPRAFSNPKCMEDMTLPSIASTIEWRAGSYDAT